eukprot:m51a1_g5390 hypothetical protein (367) ;mRNA; f:33240-34675
MALFKVEQTRCLHFDRGCQWEGIATNLASHLQQCPYEALKVYIQDKEEEITELKREIQAIHKILASLSPSPVSRVPLAFHRDAVVSLAIHEKVLFSGSMDGKLQVCDLATLQPVRDVVLGPVFQLRISNRRLYSAHAGAIRVWDLNSNALVAEMLGHKGNVKALLLYADRVISGATEEIKIWDANTLQCIYTVPNAHKGEVRDFVAVGDSTGAIMHICSGGDDGFLKVWNRNFQCERMRRAHKGPIRAMALVAIPGVGVWVATGSDDTYIRLWEASFADPQFLPAAQLPCFVSVTSLLFVPPRTLFSGHGDGVIRVWGVENASNIHCERILDGHSGHVRALAFAPDSGLLFSGSYDSSIMVWELRK